MVLARQMRANKTLAPITPPTALIWGQLDKTPPVPPPKALSSVATDGELGQGDVLLFLETKEPPSSPSVVDVSLCEFCRVPAVLLSSSVVKVTDPTGSDPVPDCVVHLRKKEKPPMAPAIPPPTNPKDLPGGCEDDKTGPWLLMSKDREEPTERTGDVTVDDCVPPDHVLPRPLDCSGC